MTAASGILHDEYHSEAFAKPGGPFKMMKLWVNLPAKDKMAPSGYQGITNADIPVVELAGGAGVARVIAGDFGGAKGPAKTFTPINVRSEEHTSELQSLMRISYAVFCLKKKNKQPNNTLIKQTPPTHRLSLQSSK